MRVRTTHDLASLLRGRRLDLGWTQGDLAGRAGVSRKWVSDFEREKTRPDLSTLLRVADVLDVCIDAAVRDSGPPGVAGVGFDVGRAIDDEVDLDAILDAHRGR
ncbi:MAG TPA: helix-turn-helix domain-containing protein [Acidimicrobiales bacterium]|nr:helix-turn-helix domain-containing protein [Acidimicrobiales bacterium]